MSMFLKKNETLQILQNRQDVKNFQKKLEYWKTKAQSSATTKEQVMIPSLVFPPPNFSSVDEIIAYCKKLYAEIPLTGKKRKQRKNWSPYAKVAAQIVYYCKICNSKYKTDYRDFAQKIGFEHSNTIFQFLNNRDFQGIPWSNLQKEYTLLENPESNVKIVETIDNTLSESSAVSPQKENTEIPTTFPFTENMEEWTTSEKGDIVIKFKRTIVVENTIVLERGSKEYKEFLEKGTKQIFPNEE